MEDLDESIICEFLKKDVNHDEINMKLYTKAFTHKSYTKDKLQCNERLEFVGDAVLNLIIGHYLYEKYPNENEGFLTRIRTKLVSGKNLSLIAKEKKFNKYIKMNERALNKEWNNNPRILEDVCESFIGALFLDRGYETCKTWILDNIIPQDDDELQKDNNYKDILMKHIQTKNMKTPIYKVFKEDGPDHSKTFTVQVYVNDMLLSNGKGLTKKIAEQDGAKKALDCLAIF